MSSEERDSDASRNNENPFIAFRRLIDQQISSAIRSLNEQAGIPNQHPPAHPATTPDERLSALFNIFGQPSLYGLAMGRGQDMQEQEARPRHFAPSQLWGCLQKVYNSRGEREFELGMCEKNTYSWWRHYSGYSPDVLIHKRDTPEHMRGYWHKAFLDLMAIHNGERMSSSLAPVRGGAEYEDLWEKFHSTEDKRGLDWSDEAPYWDDDSEFRPYPVTRFFASTKPDTEEDMYRTFLAQQDAERQAALSEASASSAVANAIAAQEQASASKMVKMLQSASGSQDQSSEIKESSVVSMVTSSHTTTMPDGSSRTIRRFKKTFADGREDSNEEIYDSHTQQSMKTIPEPENKERKKGWFWS